jgi:hypothetical protein
MILPLAGRPDVERIALLMGDPAAARAERGAWAIAPRPINADRLYSIYMDALGRPPRRT